MPRPLFAAFGLAALAACQPGDPLTFEATPLAVERFYAATYQDQPFTTSAVSVITAEHGEMRTYALRGCRNGTRICGSAVGEAVRTPDFTVVTGAYPGRTFYLSPGGDGLLERHGTLISLAWEDAGRKPPERPQ